MLADAELTKYETITNLLSENEEIIKILVKSVKTLQNPKK